MQHHFICEKVEDEVIKLMYCATEHMVADVLTKALGKERHEMLRKAMGLRHFGNSQNRSVEV